MAMRRTEYFVSIRVSSRGKSKMNPSQNCGKNVRHSLQSVIKQTARNAKISITRSNRRVLRLSEKLSDQKTTRSLQRFWKRFLRENWPTTNSPWMLTRLSMSR